MNNSMYFINPVLPVWIMVPTILVLFSFLIWKEFKRKQKYLGFRMAAQLFVLISVLGILLRPGYRQAQESSGIAVLTPGYSKSKVDSLLTAHPQLHLIRTVEAETYPQSETLKSYFDLIAVQDQIKFVVGEGLPDHILDLIPAGKFQFLPAESPAGIQQLNVSQNIKTNQQASIDGILKNDIKTTLLLSGTGGKEDSVTIQPGLSSFRLRFNTKEAGTFIYTIQYRDQEGYRTEQIPVIVKEDQKLNILLLQNYPTFETRQLKNFLAEKGHRLTLRYQVSKNNFRYEYANTTPLHITSLTPPLLAAFDLVIIDSDAIETLKPSEKISVENSIRSGLGLILLPTKANEIDQTRKRFVPISVKKTTKDTAHLGTKPNVLPRVSLQIQPSASVYSVVKNKTEILSAYTFMGLGKTGIQLLQETYRISLEGNTETYASLWSPLIEKTARGLSKKFSIKTLTDFPVYENEPLDVEIISTSENHPRLKDNGTLLPLTEDVAIDNLWFGRTWVGKPGWHQLTADSAILHYFVSERQSLKSLRFAKQLHANTIASVTRAEAGNTSTLSHQTQTSPVIYFILFLFASGFLWLAPKL